MPEEYLSANSKFKKLALSVAVIIAFVIYVIAQKSDDDDVHVIAPPSLRSSPTADVPDLTSTSTPTSTPAITVSGSTTPPTNGGVAVTPVGQYKNGTYTGNDTDAYYGNLKIQVMVSGGKISDVTFLDYPKDRQTSIQINNQAMIYLKAEAIAAQSAKVDIISGATQTSEAFIQSLGQILAQAKA
jgi:uncharacterized protein with FMN-binding domain